MDNLGGVFKVCTVRCLYNYIDMGFTASLQLSWYIDLMGFRASLQLSWYVDLQSRQSGAQVCSPKSDTDTDIGLQLVYNLVH